MDGKHQAGRRKAAARWYALLQAPEAGPGDWAEFRAWEQDPANADAFREIERALAALDASSLGAPRAAPRRRPRRAGAWVAALAAASIAAAIGLVALLDLGGRAAGPPPPTMAYATEVGEQREIALPDGSSALLNTSTRIEVTFSQSQRRVILMEGQAFFAVSPAAAPFIVEAAGSFTEATGTAFDVRLREDGPEVTLVEGRVEVRAGGVPGVALAPGERVTFTNGTALPVVAIDPATVLSWRSGILQFTDTPLAEAVAELNRYSKLQIVITDDRLGAERLSGAFRADEPELFVSAVSIFLPVTVARRGDLIEIAPAAN
jgi:transmembrane sensor